MLFGMPSLDGPSNQGGLSFSLNTAPAESLLRRAIAHARPSGLTRSSKPKMALIRQDALLMDAPKSAKKTDPGY